MLTSLGEKGRAIIQDIRSAINSSPVISGPAPRLVLTNLKKILHGVSKLALHGGTMGIVLKADFKTKLNSKLSKFNPKNTRREYHVDIFSELFEFPQFKAHVAAYVERHYCVVVNDEDHPGPNSLLEILQPDEVRMLNEWIINRHNKPSVVRQEK